jgi:putative endonuclease
MSRAAARRQQAERAGRGAEVLAALWLTLAGYRVLARRWRGPGGEIDLIARKGARAVFIEVKRRSGRVGLTEALLPAQRRRIEAAAGVWLTRFGARHGVAEVRYDLITVGPGLRLTHRRDCWRAGD